MRTTLDIDDNVLMAAKEMARRERTSAGRIVSRLLRQSFTRSEAPEDRAGIQASDSFYGFHPFATRGAAVTNELVDRLREEDDI
jgi:hypothetical protein